jgi:hypothetical protein
MIFFSARLITLDTLNGSMNYVTILSDVCTRPVYTLFLVYICRARVRSFGSWERERNGRAESQIRNPESLDSPILWCIDWCPGPAPRICLRWNIITVRDRTQNGPRTHTQQIGPALSRSWETENRPWHTFLCKWRFKVWKLAANWNPRKCLYFFIQMQSAMSERSAPLWIFISFFF